MAAEIGGGLGDPLSSNAYGATNSEESVNFATRKLLAVPISRMAHCRQEDARPRFGRRGRRRRTSHRPRDRARAASLARILRRERKRPIAFIYFQTPPSWIARARRAFGPTSTIGEWRGARRGLLHGALARPSNGRAYQRPWGVIGGVCITPLERRWHGVGKALVGRW
jgi:hypothetical protein